MVIIIVPLLYLDLSLNLILVSFLLIFTTFMKYVSFCHTISKSSQYGQFSFIIIIIIIKSLSARIFPIIASCMLIFSTVCQSLSLLSYNIESLAILKVHYNNYYFIIIIFIIIIIIIMIIIIIISLSTQILPIRTSCMFTFFDPLSIALTFSSYNIKTQSILKVHYP